MPEFIKKLGIPTLVVTLVCLVYVVAILVNAKGDPLEFVIYDGHYSYQIAYRLFDEASVIPEAYPYADELPDAYRFQRILYPLLARLFALGWPALLPWTLILLNILAIALGTWVTELYAANEESATAEPWLCQVFFKNEKIALNQAAILVSIIIFDSIRFTAMRLAYLVRFNQPILVTFRDSHSNR